VPVIIIVGSSRACRPRHAIEMAVVRVLEKGARSAGRFAISPGKPVMAERTTSDSRRPPRWDSSRENCSGGEELVNQTKMDIRYSNCIDV
jgi:hypothetical protein